VIVGGSLYLVGEAMELLHLSPAKAIPSAAERMEQRRGFSKSACPGGSAELMHQLLCGRVKFC